MIREGVVDLSFDQANSLIDSEVPAVIEFWSPSSGACHIMSHIFDRLAEIYVSRVSFYRINLELETKTGEKFGVAASPSFVFLVDGEIVDRIFGVTSKREIKDILDTLLNS